MEWIFFGIGWIVSARIIVEIIDYAYIEIRAWVRRNRK